MNFAFKLIEFNLKLYPNQIQFNLVKINQIPINLIEFGWNEIEFHQMQFKLNWIWNSNQFNLFELNFLGWITFLKVLKTCNLNDRFSYKFIIMISNVFSCNKMKGGFIFLFHFFKSMKCVDIMKLQHFFLVVMKVTFAFFSCTQKCCLQYQHWCMWCYVMTWCECDV